jgi:hypothetical protein
MAGLRVAAENTAVVALAAATAKTALQLNAPANQRLKLLRAGIFFDGASTTAVPVLVRAIRKTTAGTGTALTLTKQVSSDSETIQTTATENHTAEGTGTTDIIDQWLIHPQMGIDITLAFGQEKIIVGGGRVALVVTAPAVVNCLCKIEFEE